MTERTRVEQLKAFAESMRDIENRMEFVCSCSDAISEISAYVDAMKKLSTDAAIDCLISRIREHIDGSIEPLLGLVYYEAWVANIKATRAANAKAAKAAKAEGATSDNVA